MSRLTPFGFLFGKNLTDLIRGIRRYPDTEQRNEYLRDVIAECRDEVRSPDLNVKTTAILKLAYLEMLGYDMMWAGFHVTEVMASPHFQQKRIGYIAAMQSFRSDPELLMLVTNLLKMDLVNQNTAIVGIALSGLATIVTPLLAADVADDIMRMLAHSKPYIRKKAVLALHNVVLQYPEVLPVALKRISDLLDAAQQDLADPGNVSVVGATVSVICELATHAPSVHEFLELTPKLYAVLTTSQHNWTLIKLLKIFQLFVRVEPRLKSRILPAVRDMMETSGAISLVYESVNCILLGKMLDDDDFELAKDIGRQIGEMLYNGDANLTLLGTSLLDEMAKINPLFVSKTQVNSLLKVSQPDPVTRKNIMVLASHIVDDDTFYDLTNELVVQFRSTHSLEHKKDIAETISRITAANKYEYVPDFQWLISDVFAEISKQILSLEIAHRLLDIVLRVKDDRVREAVSNLCYQLLGNYVPAGNGAESEDMLDEITSSATSGATLNAIPSATLNTKFTAAGSKSSANTSTNVTGDSAGDNGKTGIIRAIDHIKNSSSDASNQEFYETCWWIIGEFPTKEMLADPLSYIKHLMSYLGELSVSPAVVTSVIKLISKTSKLDNEILDAAIDLLTPYSFSLEYELQERSCQFLELLKLARSTPEKAGTLLENVLTPLFNIYDLTPIAPGSQLKVRPPADLDLDTPVSVPRGSQGLEFELDVDSEVESEPESVVSTRGSTPLLPNEDAESASIEETAERKLYNLSLMDAMRQSNTASPLGLVRPVKKKVVIAADETVEGPDDSIGSDAAATASAVQVARSGSSGKKPSQVFQSGFRGSSNLLIESDVATIADPPPVKVKHKKQKKKKHSSKSQTPDSESTTTDRTQ